MSNQYIHPSVNADRVMELIEDARTTCANPGICLRCGEDADGCEPDAERIVCEVCGEDEVYGAEAILVANLFHL